MPGLVHRLTLAAVLGMAPWAAHAQSGKPADLAGLVHGFLASIQDGTATPYFFDNAPPALIAALAAKRGLSATQLRESITRGEKVNAEHFTLAEFAVFEPRAITGQSEPWRWSLVPVFTRTEPKTDTVRSAAACSHLLAFGNSTKQFLVGALSQDEQTIFLRLFPELDNVPFDAKPDCGDKTP